MKLRSIAFAASAAMTAFSSLAWSSGFGDQFYKAFRGNPPGIELPRIPLPAVSSPYSGRFCWTRGIDLTAESLNMPKTFCISDAHVVRNGPGYSAEIKGEPVSGSLYAKNKAGNIWTARLFENGETSGSCSYARNAGIWIEFTVDPLGYMTGIPGVSAFSEETPDTCHSRFDRTEILFSRSDLGTASYSWRRNSDQIADKLGMPSEMTISGMRVEGEKLAIEGFPVSGSFAVRFTDNGNGGMTAEATLFEGRMDEGACSYGMTASVAVTFLTDKNGTVKSPPSLSARAGQTPDTCHSPVEYKEIAFSRK